MKTKTFKTMHGIIKAYGHNHVSVSKFFSNKGIYCYPYYLKPSKALKEKVAKFFAACTWQRGWREKAEALVNGNCNLDILQYFYVGIEDGKPQVDNSLSGDAYEYCRRAFSRSIKKPQR